ncbi:aldo/keto reductase [Staphylococcus sp. 17KM0847]|uniref:aldo/keto reductase n=1 Tax=Staphylococcus sp. 17KM0847 TaxID=2583989 RepID=UPI0015DC4BCB|nr:aldo/keto reductase [Staphylococcus sp. 17KM0847]QLK85252.1 aldo/keto reductase [Staphylococcus sp. 17KM0847]
MEYRTLNNGNKMPHLGLGVFRVQNDDTAKNAVKHAIESGYRSIDTALVYKNEQKVGEGIREALASTGLKREELFITSKLWFDDFGRENVKRGYNQTLENLGLDYLDLYLVHWPGLDEKVMIETWKGMEDLYREGSVKNIGVSNFNITHLETLKTHTSIKPVINQIEFHPYLTQTDLIDYLNKEDIQPESWSPLMNAEILNDATIQEIAEEIGKSPAQVVIRWNIENGVITIPKSVTPSRIEENINVFDFALDEKHMKKIAMLNQNKRIGPDPLVFNGQ